MDGTVNATTTEHALVSRIDDRIDMLCDDVSFDECEDATLVGARFDTFVPFGAYA